MPGVQQPTGEAADFDVSDEDVEKKLTRDCTGSYCTSLGRYPIFTPFSNID